MNGRGAITIKTVPGAKSESSNKRPFGIKIPFAESFSEIARRHWPFRTQSNSSQSRTCPPRVAPRGTFVITNVRTGSNGRLCRSNAESVPRASAFEETGIQCTPSGSLVIFTKKSDCLVFQFMTGAAGNDGLAGFCFCPKNAWFTSLYYQFEDRLGTCLTVARANGSFQGHPISSLSARPI